MKKALIIALLAMLAMGMVFAAGSQEAAAPKAKEIKVALIVSSTIDDTSFSIPSETDSITCFRG